MNLASRHTKHLINGHEGLEAKSFGGMTVHNPYYNIPQLGYLLKEGIEESMKDWTTPLVEGGNTSVSRNPFMDSHHNSPSYFSTEHRNIQ